MVDSGVWADVNNKHDVVYEQVIGGISQILIATRSTAPLLTLSGGNNQTGNVLTRLTTPLVVQTTNPDGTPVSGIPISFQVTHEPSGVQTHATLTVTSTATTLNGVAATELTLGDLAGQYQVRASCTGG